MTPQGWEEKTLGEILDKGSSNLSANKLDNGSGSYPVYGASGLAAKVDFYQQDSEYLAIIKDGAGVGRVYHYEPKTSVLGTLQYLHPKQGTNIRFAYYYLQSIDFAKYYQGAAIPHIYYRDYKNEKLVLPPLSEQERIVAKLDKAYEAIDKAKTIAETNLKNAKELFESALNKAFTENKENWEEKKLSEVCEKITDGSHFSPQSNSNEKFPYITVKDIDNNDKINFDNCKFINQEDYDTLCRSGCRPVCGDILFSKDGTVGKVSLVDYDKQFVVLSSLAIITPMQKLIQPKFLMYILKTPRFLAEAIGRKTGVAIRRIILKNLKTISLHFPKNIAEQQKIVEKLDALQEQTKQLEAIYTQRIKECDELKQSILQKAFRGEL